MIPFVPIRFRILGVWTATAVCVVACIVGCNHAQRIADSAARIDDASLAIKADATEIAVEASKPADVVDLPVIVSAASRIVSAANTIHSEVQGVQRSLTNVENKTSEWVAVLWWLAVAAVVAGITFLLWRSGILFAIAGFLRLVVPRQKAAVAAIAADVLDESRPEQARELVAAMRVADFQIDQAFRAQKAAASAVPDVIAAGGVPVNVVTPTVAESATVQRESKDVSRID